MGIDVSPNKVVTFNATHNRLVNTNIEQIPMEHEITGCKISCIFQRRKSSSGDGNPLIYALKGKDGYSISRRELTKFLGSFYVLLEKILGQKSADIIVPMPSSHPIALIIARRIARRMNNQVLILNNLFQKKTIDEVSSELEDLLQNSLLSKKECRSIEQLIARLGKVKGKMFSMKNVDIKSRAYINPLKLSLHSPEISMTLLRIIVVDDLVASGSTLSAAVNLLRELYPNAHIEGICLFSKL
ncbi:phosphoribosyltransferase family protein [Beggiatoa leptomitoformis]|uniref:Uncharacterized protein n=1 Tax=Beggiatoa leptomitoformis TaxID=288004 RepID=A0A2N9YGF5_9GAMM|nr:phosphoribosyltransferase family protein [Beggiatoa leptomitoformis]ALG68058.1 hypothetical protein AL038_10505 [Beggiatoa leptomitoformis]AUI69651.1 hypothetical protein BLE401_13770 [Beggiatoa leptomitoformis]